MGVQSFMLCGYLNNIDIDILLTVSNALWADKISLYLTDPIRSVHLYSGL